jgi:malonyl-CoA O-methyltransferase/biotin synthesis protein BioG
MDKRLIAERFAKAAGTYGREATVQNRIASHMATLLQRHADGRRFDTILEIGCGTGSYSRMLLEHFVPKRLVINDLCPEMLQQCADLTDAGVVSLPGDAEHIELPEGQSLITSCSALQWFERPGEFFDKCCRCLNADGMLAISSFGKDNMKEVAELTGESLPYPSTDELCRELSRHYDVVCVEEERISKSFATPKEVLRHLKETGVTGLRSRHWTPRQLMEFCNKYNEKFGTGHEVTLTYHPIYIVATRQVARVKG